MGYLSALSFATILNSPLQTAKVLTGKEVLTQAQVGAAKLTSKTERAVAYLTIAQAQNSLSDRAGALMSLDLGWEAWTKGSDKDVPEGDRFDCQWLVDKGDISTIPTYYSIEFLVSGSKEKAILVADTYGDSDLGKSYRQNIGLEIRDRFPDDFEEIAFTRADQTTRKAQREKLLAGVGVIRSETDATKRATLLYQCADKLMTLGDPGDGLRLLREAVALAPQFSDNLWRLTFLAQSAMGMWQMGAKVEAKDLITRVSLSMVKATGDKDKFLIAKFAVEQSKRTMGLPNKLSQVTNEMDKARGTILPTSIPIPPEGQEKSAYAYLAAAESDVQSGNIASAKQNLAKMKTARKGELGRNGWYQVLAAELQLKMGDRAGAKVNLNEGAKLYVASLKPAKFMPTEEIGCLARIAEGLVGAWDRPSAVRYLREGIARLSAGETIFKMPHLGEGGNRMVDHDRRSPILHWGAEALARTGDFPGAVAMARSIPHSAHRVIALAGVIRDSSIRK